MSILARYTRQFIRLSISGKARRSLLIFTLILVTTSILFLRSASAQEATPEPEVTAESTQIDTPVNSGILVVPVITINPPNPQVVVIGTPGSADGLASRAFDKGHPKYDLAIRLTLIGGIFLFAFVAIFLLFNYLRDGLTRSFNAIERANGKSTILEIAPLASSRNAAQVRDLTAGTALPPKLIVSGPTEINVGKAAPFSARIEPPAGHAPDKIAWKLTNADGTPASGAALTQSTGESSQLIAIESGLYTISVEAAGVGVVELTINARESKPEPKETSAVSIPFVGQGYGTLMLAIFLLMIVALLTVNSNISPTTTATLLGSIAGYIFGVTNPGTKEK